MANNMIKFFTKRLLCSQILIVFLIITSLIPVTSLAADSDTELNADLNNELNLEWTIRESGSSVELIAVTWGNNQFVAVGCNGTIETSPDGAEWTVSRDNAHGMFYDVIWGDN